MKRFITLPNGKPCSLPVYCAAWRQLKALPPDAEIRGFKDWPEPARDVLREMHYGLHNRINRHDPRYMRGRKWSNDWQRAAIQCGSCRQHAEAHRAARSAPPPTAPDFILTNFHGKRTLDIRPFPRYAERMRSADNGSGPQRPVAVQGADLPATYAQLSPGNRQ